MTGENTIPSCEPFARCFLRILRGCVLSRAMVLHLEDVKMPPKLRVSAGERYGMLTIIKEVERRVTPSGRPYRRFRCQCDCGKDKIVDLANLKHNGLKSCGCIIVTHGRTRNGTYDPTYKRWVDMRKRCSNPRSTNYKNYGGRGITVCDRWDDFTAFLEDMGECPSPNHQIERIDNDGNYDSGNCCWATRIQQSRNRRNNTMITFRGETLCLAEWAERIGMNYRTLQDRLAHDWTVEQALTIPTGTRR